MGRPWACVENSMKSSVLSCRLISSIIKNAIINDELSTIQGSHAVLEVLNFKIVFQDFEKVLNLAKMHIRY